MHESDETSHSHTYEGDCELRIATQAYFYWIKVNPGFDVWDFEVGGKELGLGIQ